LKVDLDLAGEVCPYTFLRTKLALEELPMGAELHVTFDHPPAAENVPRSLAAEGQEIISVEKQETRFLVIVVKRSEPHFIRKETNEF
jgi:tRNA 2-thiouridine synthesizing protein A